MKAKYYYLLFILLYLNLQKAAAQQDPALTKFYDDKLKANGVIAPADLLLLPYADIERVATFNFDEYRAYDKNQKVQLKKGALVELVSIQERIREEIKIESSLVEKKKSIASVTYKYENIPFVDVRIGYKEPILGKEKSTYFLNR